MNRVLQLLLENLNQLIGLSNFTHAEASEHVVEDPSHLRSKMRQVFAEKERFKELKVTAQKKAQVTYTRRAISLIPGPIEQIPDQEMITQTSEIRFHQLLICIEGSQRSGCLQVYSPTKKSRSAVLVYRGRVVGALWGQRNKPEQCFEQEALTKALSDMACPHNLLHAYQLPEEIVLAAASLFHGTAIDTQAASSEESYAIALSEVLHSNLPGCVLIRHADNKTLCVYAGAGKILNVYSNVDGWVDTSRIASFLLEPGTVVAASVLPARTSEEAYKLGVSLTGVGDYRKPAARPDAKSYVRNDELIFSPSGKTTARLSLVKPINVEQDDVKPIPGLRAEKSSKVVSYSGFHQGTSVGTNPVRHSHMIRP